MSAEDLGYLSLPPEIWRQIEKYTACGDHDWQPDEERPERLRCTRCRYVRYPHRPHRKSE